MAMQAEAWGTQTELIAQLVELFAIKAAGMQTKGEPRRIERPEFLTRPQSQGDGFAHALNVLKSTALP